MIQEPTEANLKTKTHVYHLKSERLLWKMNGSQNEIPFEYTANKILKQAHPQILKVAQKILIFSSLPPWTAQMTQAEEFMFQNLA